MPTPLPYRRAALLPPLAPAQTEQDRQRQRARDLTAHLLTAAQMLALAAVLLVVARTALHAALSAPVIARQATIAAKG